MTDKPKSDNSKLFLFGQPELLREQDHQHLGLTPSESPYAFAASARAIPLTLPEFMSAQRHYPVVFTNIENPYPVAVVGLLEDRNLFIEDGAWTAGYYVPAYLRCHPFAFAGEKDGRLAVVVDRTAVTVTEEPRYPFFVDGKLASETESMMRLCGQYEAERRRTEEFARELLDLGLLASQRATQTPNDGGEDVTLANYVSVDAEKLAGLDDATVVKLHRAGYLAAAYQQLYSLENWQPLLDRRAAAMAN